MFITAVAEALLTRIPGPTVELRPLEYGDRASLLEIFAGLGPRSRERRFLTPKTRLTESELRHLTAVDQHDHVALLAVSAADGRPVGVARFIRDARRPDTADVAVSVVDAWQDRGIGTLLTNALARRAREVGVRRFTVLMQRDNRAARRLLHRSGGSPNLVEADQETVEFVVDLEVG
jgi:RimJ/RimL family protein N-acetyltransferase